MPEVRVPDDVDTRCEVFVHGAKDFPIGFSFPLNEDLPWPRT